MHEKRFKKPTIENFDDPKCHGKHLGDKAVSEENQVCLKFTPPNQYIKISWGDGNGELWTEPNEHCVGDPPLTKIYSGGNSHSCIPATALGEGVQSVYFPMKTT